MYLVSNVTLTGYEQLVHTLGGHSEEILSEVGLLPVNISDSAGFVSYLRYAELLEATAKTLNMPLFGLKLASRHGPDLLGPLSLGFCLQKHLKQALDYLLSHAYLFAYGQILTVKQSNGWVQVSIEYEFGDENSLSQLRQSSCQHLYNYLTSVQVDNLDAMKINLRQPRPPAHERHYSHVCFSADFDGVSFPAECLTASLSAGRAQMLQFVVYYID